MLGLSVLLFNNQNIILIPFSFALLLLAYLTAKKILKSYFLSLLAIILFSCEYLFLNRSTYAYLDLMHAFFILLFIYLAIKNKEGNRFKFIALGLTLGAVASIKYPVPAIILAFSYFLKELVENKLKLIKKYFLFFIFYILFFILTYSPLFLKQGMGAFLSLQEKALRIHLSHLPEYPPLIPLRVMFTNQWPIWWNEKSPILKTIEWNLFWPILAGAIILSPIFYFLEYKQTKKQTHILFFIFSILYFIFLNTRLFFPGYLFLLLPNLYIILFWEIKLLTKCVRNVIINHRQ
jgi:predicted membrane-bound dolichyl-phosphate-mannose-protein mannosyltransferase